MTEPKPPVLVKLNPDPEEYQEAETKFFYTLGLCTNGWAYVDRQLYRLFRHSLQSDRLRSAILYYKQKACPNVCNT